LVKFIIMSAFKTWQKIVILIGGIFILLLFIHHFIFRPLILDWGAPKALRVAELPGDALTEGVHHTRAILIEATPDEIWPWLVQLGQERGGFYSYQWLENIFRARMKNTYDIKLNLQRPREAGDTVWLAARANYDGKAYQVIEEVDPPSTLVMVSGDDFLRIRHGLTARGSWAFYLYPANVRQTWLVVRSSDGHLNVANRVLRYFFFEVPHFIMERKMLMTVKELAEQKKQELNIINDEDDLGYE